MGDREIKDENVCLLLEYKSIKGTHAAHIERPRISCEKKFLNTLANWQAYYTEDILDSQFILDIRAMLI